MPKEENLFETYTREICRNCKNKETCQEELHIRVDNTIKCYEYERDPTNIKGYEKPLNKTAKVQPLVMKGFVSDWSNC